MTGAEPRPRKVRRYVAGAAAVILILVAGVVIRTTWSESDKRSAIEWSGLSAYVSPGDIAWLESRSAPDGQTYRYFARIPASRMSPEALGRAATDDHFLLRDEIRVDGVSDVVYRTISYFRNSAELAGREVALVVGVSNSLRALAG
ncbi:hypothetical protein [Tsukamurella paurometabola]|uniref:Uncharacterized protein n=1 Tax=Tsukamurella paurometabola TaxID=2061 RepID=A0ABS5NJM9_TSUPA|nr:hypothetical protein [Tsukamurella paurometabola]MBS4104491.1 hypothetical protein [Tsukamurella paurometabola]